MRLIERMLVVALAAGLSSACSNSPDVPDPCPEYDDVENQAWIELTVANNGTRSFYMPDCEFMFDLAAGGVTRPIPPPLPEPTCERVRRGEEAWPCNPAKWDEGKPNTTFGTIWYGQFYEQTQMPARCLASQKPATCWRAIPAAAGPMQVIFHAYATKDCSGGAGCVYTDRLSVTGDFIYAPSPDPGPGQMPGIHMQLSP